MSVVSPTREAWGFRRSLFLPTRMSNHEGLLHRNAHAERNDLSESVAENENLKTETRTGSSSNSNWNGQQVCHPNQQKQADPTPHLIPNREAKGKRGAPVRSSRLVSPDWPAPLRLGRRCYLPPRKVSALPRRRRPGGQSTSHHLQEASLTRVSSGPCNSVTPPVVAGSVIRLGRTNEERNFTQPVSVPFLVAKRLPSPM